MQQTENLKLKLVEGTDTFSPEPLNENMRLLDENAGRLDGSMEEMDGDIKKLDGDIGKLGENIGKLDESLKLLDGTAKRLEAELAKKGTCSVAEGTFLGDGATAHEIEMGFSPTFVILYGDYNGGNTVAFVSRSWEIMVKSGGTLAVGTNVKMTENGFSVSGNHFNRSNAMIKYAAFA